MDRGGVVEMSSCVLKCVNESHEDVVLSDGHPVIVGRGPLTRIKNPKCSRQQVELIADSSKGFVRVKQLGSNPSCVNGKQLLKNEEVTLVNGQILCLLYDEFPYKVHFVNDNTQNDDFKIENKKRTRVEDEDNKHKREKKIEEDERDEERLKDIEEQLQQLKNNYSKSIKNEFEQIYVDDDGLSRESSIPFGWYQPNKSLLVFTCKDIKSSEKIASFDLDGTIICTKSGKVFPTNFTDWKILNSEIKPKLKRIYGLKYKIVIFTNQKSLGNWKTNIDEFKAKIEKIVAELDVPFQVLISMGNAIFRKPAPGMWDYLVNEANSGIEIDMQSSFYVGDAAGRENKWAVGKKKDFSISDRLFALNIGLKFHTPEEYFLGWDKAKFQMPSFDPRKLSCNSNLFEPKTSNLISSKQEVILFVGFPAAGKSFFFSKHLSIHDYVQINRDMLKTWQKCLAVCKSQLSKGKSVVIDNTNPDKQSREKFIKCAQEFSIPCRCFKFDISLDHAKHNNKFRQLVSQQDEVHAQVNDIVLNSYKSKLEEPNLAEGFSSILTIQFVPIFNDEKKEKLYRMFLT